MSLLNKQTENSILYVSLNKPEVRNAFDPDMIKELTQLFIEADKNKNLRAMVLFGEGKVFCAGADLSWMKDMMNYSLEQNKSDATELYKMFEAAGKCSLPIVGVVHGAAFGGALGLIAICDYVVAEVETQFCFSEAKLGIAPAVISTFVLQKAALGFVQPYMISGQVFDAQTALRAGLVHEITKKGQGIPQARAVAQKWLEAGPEASREIKKLLMSIQSLDKNQQAEKTIKLIAERRVSTEGQEGLRSFLEKRDPSWKDSHT